MDSTRRHPHSDYYAVLGLRKNASQQEIKHAYHELARRYHPDANAGNTQAESRFKEINEAYSVLADPEKRQEYDARVSRRETTHQQRDDRRSRAPSVYRPGGVPGTASGRFGRFSSVPPRQSASPPRVAANLNLTVAGLSLGLHIVDNLMARLDRAVSSSERTTPPRGSPPGSRAETDRRR